jgi:hypothetical protein
LEAFATRMVRLVLVFPFKKSLQRPYNSRIESGYKDERDEGGREIKIEE